MGGGDGVVKVGEGGGRGMGLKNPVMNNQTSKKQSESKRHNQ
jgi:hypothetical protein